MTSGVSHVLKCQLKSWKRGNFVSGSPKCSLEGGMSVRSVIDKNPDLVFQFPLPIIKRVSRQFVFSQIHLFLKLTVFHQIRFYNVIRRYRVRADLDRKLRSSEPRAIEALTRYKKGIANGTSIMEIVFEFEKVFKIFDVERYIDMFVEMCKQELNAVHFNDVKQVVGSFQLFTDLNSEQTWFRQHRSPKVLLKTDGLSQVNGNLFLSFYDLCAGLKQLGFEIGVSLPSVANSSLSLSIKINADSQVYTNESISFALKILHVIVDKPSEENYNIKRF